MKPQTHVDSLYAQASCALLRGLYYEIIPEECKFRAADLSPKGCWRREFQRGLGWRAQTGNRKARVQTHLREFSFFDASVCVTHKHTYTTFVLLNSLFMWVCLGPHIHI